MDVHVVRAGDHSQGHQAQILQDDKNNGDAVPEVELGVSVGQSSKLDLLVLSQGLKHHEGSDINDELDGGVQSNSKSEQILHTQGQKGAVRVWRGRKGLLKAS